MERIKERFKKNGLQYLMLDRTEHAALFELRLPEGDLAGYEVSRIYVNKAGERFGRYYPESEAITSNDRFGSDGSKAYFPQDIEMAKQYLKTGIKAPVFNAG